MGDNNSLGGTYPQSNNNSLGGNYSQSTNGSNSPQISIRTPSPQDSLSYDEMKKVLEEYDIIGSFASPISDDEARSVYIFEQDGVKKVLKMGNKLDRGDTTKYKLLKKEHAIYEQINTLPPELRGYFPILYDGGDIDNTMYFILIEYIEGRVLTDYINDVTPKSENDVLRVLLQLAQALEALRSIKLVHGDLSTENIIVTRDTVKIIDFEKTFPLLRPTDIDVNVRGSVAHERGYLFILTLLYKLLQKDTNLPKDTNIQKDTNAKLYTSLIEEIHECKATKTCDTFYTSAIAQLTRALESQTGGFRKNKRAIRNTRNKKVTKLKKKGKTLKRTRFKRN